MQGVRDVQCKKCSHIENIYINVEEGEVGNYSLKNTFFCKNCEQLSTLNTIKEKYACKNCHSSELSKYFSEDKIKCPKCGSKAFFMPRF